MFYHLFEVFWTIENFYRSLMKHLSIWWWIFSPFIGHFLFKLSLQKCYRKKYRFSAYMGTKIFCHNIWRQNILGY